MATLNTFNRHLDDDRFPYTGDFIFYTVDFMDIYSGQHYFRIIDAGINMTHDERMAHFDRDINGREETRYTITAYELDDGDLDEDWMRENDIVAMRFKETYWSAVLQGAV